MKENNIYSLIQEWLNDNNNLAEAFTCLLHAPEEVQEQIYEECSPMFTSIENNYNVLKKKGFDLLKGNRTSKKIDDYKSLVDEFQKSKSILANIIDNKLFNKLLEIEKKRQHKNQ